MLAAAAAVALLASPAAAPARTINGCRVEPHANCRHKQGANLIGARLQKTDGDFHSANLTGANMTGVKSCEVTLPDGSYHGGGCPPGFLGLKEHGPPAQP